MFLSGFISFFYVAVMRSNFPIAHLFCVTQNDVMSFAFSFRYPFSDVNIFVILSDCDAAGIAEIGDFTAF